MYTYDLLGNMLTSTDGAGHTFTSTYNQAGRITSLTSSLVDANHPATLLSNVHYGAFGLTSDSLGNGIAETKTSTPCGFLDVFTSGSVYSLDLNYHPDGNISTANDSVNGN
jgi:YD repeat-containing protein